MRSILKLTLAGLGVAAIAGVAFHGVHARAASSLPAYVVNEIAVRDPALFATYAQKQGALVARFGGVFLARGGEVQTLSGPPVNKRITIYMFGSLEQEKAWHDAPEQKELVALRDKASDFSAYVVEGCATCDVSPFKQ